MSFSTAIVAADSEIKSSGVTTLEVVLPKMKSPGRLKGVMAARQRALVCDNGKLRKIGHVASCVARATRDESKNYRPCDMGGYPNADVLLAYADYIAVIENAPESVPWAYRVREKHLNERWAKYQRDRDTRRAPGATADKY